MSAEQIETIHRMSGLELRELVSRGMVLPASDKERWRRWEVQQFRASLKSIDPATRFFRLFAIGSLQSTVCPGCDGGKGARKSFCGTCYGRLPAGLKADLYRSFGRGYEKAFAASLDTLFGRTGK